MRRLPGTPLREAPSRHEMHARWVCGAPAPRVPHVSTPKKHAL